MPPTDVQRHAILARIAHFAGANEFDRLFPSVEIAELDGGLLYVLVDTSKQANEIKTKYLSQLSKIATSVLQRDVYFVTIFTKELYDTTCEVWM